MIFVQKEYFLNLKTKEVPKSATLLDGRDRKKRASLAMENRQPQNKANKYYKLVQSKFNPLFFDRTKSEQDG